MKVIADRSRCEGHAQCNIVDPDLFPLGEDGFTAIAGELPVPPGEEEQARLGVSACPVAALRLSD